MTSTAFLDNSETSTPSSAQPHIVAVVLAAGRSTRFGSDKRLAAVDNQTVLQRTIETVYPLVRRVVVTLKPEDRGREQQLLGRFAELPAIEPCYATGARDGLSGSINDAMRMLANSQDSIEGVLIALGDMPFVRADTIALLIQHWAADKIVRPCYHDPSTRRAAADPIVSPTIPSAIPGNPVLFGASWLPQLQRCQGDTGAKFILRNNPDAVVEVAVDDAGVLRDIDQPEDLKR